ncbi:hypothetical protein IWQ60_009669 [Tieghemiomyces parasiticus]|uniref:NAD(P)-binding protein n=1 Tax=Tieghemiomyces parasiticus TaxID=78921 RepID=A0A9W7ZWW7_9FUNG|nr:hypothetical protein IWQ60_009669 [Tieghemiomyces parasiticus]
MRSSTCSNRVITARRADRLEKLKAELVKTYPSVRVHATALDVTSKDQIDQVVSELPVDFQYIDVLINNAGMGRGMVPIAEYCPADIDAMVDTNVKGVIYGCQAFIPRMKRSPLANGGTIINVSSIAGHDVRPTAGIYSATKHAVDAITRTLRYELAGTNVRITALSPGLVETEFVLTRLNGDRAKAAAAFRGMTALQAQDIAETALFIASRPAHVEVAEVIVLPKGQASYTYAHRKEV